MYPAFNPSRSVIVLKDNRFRTCVFVDVEDSELLSEAPNGVTITVGGEVIVKQFADDMSVAVDRISFLLLDLGEKDAEMQIIGYAPNDPFYDDPTPSNVISFFA